MTTEPGFECPDCGRRLHQGLRCHGCGWKRAPRAEKAPPSLPAAYREPPAHAAYVEPTEAEHREIRIKLGETIDKLACSMTHPGRGILHERGVLERGEEIPSRFATDGERQAEAARQLEAFRVWQEGGR